MTSDRRADLPASPAVSDDDAARSGAAMALDAGVAGTVDAAGQPTQPVQLAQPAQSAAQPAEPVTVDPLVPPAPAATTAVPPAEQPAVQPSRRGAVARGGLRFAQFAFGIGLFVFGIWIGVQAFQAAQKPSDAEQAQVVSNGIPTPPVVQEFADALGSGGPDAVRSSVSPDVFALLVGEVQRDSIATIKKVDVLGTAVDGPRSATGLILTSTLNDGTTLWVNLIVQTENGKITTLR